MVPSMFWGYIEKARKYMHCGLGKVSWSLRNDLWFLVCSGAYIEKAREHNHNSSFLLY